MQLYSHLQKLNCLSKITIQNFLVDDVCLRLEKNII